MPAVVRGKSLTLPLVVAVAISASTGVSAPASAQGLLQSLFGFGSPPPPRLPPQMYYPQRPNSPFMSPYGGRPGAGSGFGGEGGGSYRTVCVRMCDGYYFPISHGVSRSRFSRDAAACQSSCGSEARLFYAPGNGGAEDFVDLGGRPYSQIPNAFKYRKALSPSCACKAAPWSEAEIARHQRYAAEASRAATVAASEPQPRTSSGKVAAAVTGKPKTATESVPHKGIVIVDPAPPAAGPKGGAALPKEAGGSHSVQEVETPPAQPAPIPRATVQAAKAQPARIPAPQVQAAQPDQPQPAQLQPGLAQAQPSLTQPGTQPQRPAVSATARGTAPGSQTGARTGTRMAVGGPPQPAPVKVASKPAAAPVYSQELGRFVFPGDNRYR